jgi:hypothetical protein
MRPQPNGAGQRSILRLITALTEAMMRAAVMWSCGIAMAIAVGLGGCVPSPGPGTYAAGADYHAQQAQRDWAYGDPNAAQWEQFQANKDAWISGF